MKKTKKYFCEDCGKNVFVHVFTWLDEIFRPFSSLSFLPLRVETGVGIFLQTTAVFLRLGTWNGEFLRGEVHLRTFCFAEEMRKRGILCEVFKTPFGYTDNVRIKTGGKAFYFESLPVACRGETENFVEDKIKTKELLKKNSFPVLPGKSFFFYQKNKALDFARINIGFPKNPVVIKPRNGSLSRHITTNICDEDSFLKAIKKSAAYSPSFIVERYMPSIKVYRATAVDFENIFCVEKSSAKITGNGFSAIEFLIHEENKKSERGEQGKKGYTLHCIIIDENVREALRRQNYNLQSVPERGVIVELQKDPFMRLGGSLHEVTPLVHEDNKKLFADIAKLFDIRLVGIDFLAEDISRSWKNQACAILELNNMPNIGIHQFPSSGVPQNCAGSVADLFFKFYVNR